MTILVVDDERSIRDIIKRYMEEKGYHVVPLPVEKKHGPSPRQRINGWTS